MLSSQEIFENNEGILLYEWDHYFEIYDFHLGLKQAEHVLNT